MSSFFFLLAPIICLLHVYLQRKQSISISDPKPPPKKRPKLVLPQEPETLILKRGRPNFNYGTLNDDDFNEDDYIIHSPDTALINDDTVLINDDAVLINDDTILINDDTIPINDTPEEKPKSESRNAWMEPIVEEMMIVGNTSLSIMRMMNQVIGKYYMSIINFGFILS